MYKFMILDDGTEVVHSDPFDQDGIETVKVYFEKPVFGDFESAECYLPTYEWKNIDGFSEDRISYFTEYLKSVAHIIIRLAGEGVDMCKVMEKRDQKKEVTGAIKGMRRLVLT